MALTTTNKNTQTPRIQNKNREECQQIILIINNQNNSLNNEQ